MKSFGSDNHSGIHPRIAEAICNANNGHSPAYGDDCYTKELEVRMKDLLGDTAIPYVIFSGTGANILALRGLTRPYDGIICAETAHINENETGAPEFQTGCKLLTVWTPDGKLTSELVATRLQSVGNPHRPRPRVVSITQPTELGTVYTLDEIRELVRFAHSNNLYVHVDGARLGNACAATGVSARDMITESGVDALSFGGTKNGLMCGEIVVFFDQKLAEGAIYERKQLLQLSSKMRFISAQFIEYIKDDLWLRTAEHANRMASLLAAKISGIDGIEILYPVESNGIFVQIPRAHAMRIREKYPFNISPGDPCTARWMCSFDTTEQDIEQFVDTIKNTL